MERICLDLAQHQLWSSRSRGWKLGLARALRSSHCSDWFVYFAFSETPSTLPTLLRHTDSPIPRTCRRPCENFKLVLRLAVVGIDRRSSGHEAVGLVEGSPRMSYPIICRGHLGKRVTAQRHPCTLPCRGGSPQSEEAVWFASSNQSPGTISVAGRVDRWERGIGTFPYPRDSYLG